ncbi:hypothetical protein Pcinc_000780 [Petrolisthes cinctipes]|uniref:Uncharacterized protein n=1 Tax=Petrolisthes cinctipes TaxID=88211 RepID=A0AAE1GN21_PETCI|nr:hypothetical protein Pcinc_000780 [Petrolisthes cinctipes]
MGGNFAPRALLSEVEGLLKGESTFLNRHIEVKEEVKRELADRQPWGSNGLRDDGCLHQHCLHGDYNTENGYLDHTLALIYNGNYGKEMLKYLSNLFTWYTGTIYDYDEESIEGLFSAYLECNQWLFRGNVFEPTTTGRFITGGSTVTKIAAKDSVSVTGNYLLKLGRHQEEVQAALHRYDQSTPDVQYALVGHKHFFNSDLTVHQRRDYMASVRILSNRTSRQETWTSGQNKDGFFQEDHSLIVTPVPRRQTRQSLSILQHGHSTHTSQSSLDVLSGRHQDASTSPPGPGLRRTNCLTSQAAPASLMLRSLMLPFALYPFATPMLKVKNGVVKVEEKITQQHRPVEEDKR